MKQQILNRYTNAVIYECDLPDGTAHPIRDALVKAIASSANLRFADLSSADLRSANLRFADLRSADLSSADLSSADLSFADLSFADLSSADLRFANLRSANLRSADLRFANLSHGRLIGDRPYFSIGCIGSRQDHLTLWMTDAGNVFKTGCFTGSLEEFEESIKKTHGDNNHAKEYAAAIAMCKAHIEIWTTKEVK